LAGAPDAGATLNVRILPFVGSPAIAACSRSLLQWASVSGRRLCRQLDDRRGAPFAPLGRVALSLVDAIHLARDGRESPKERAGVLLACKRAETATCTYSNLVGLSEFLDWGDGLCPYLNLRRVRFRQCHLAADDVVQFLRCTPRLEVAAFISEALAGIGEAFDLNAPPECKELVSVELTDCDLLADDAAVVLQALPCLRSVRLQAMNLAGFTLTSKLLTLEEASLQDCALAREDVVSLMAACPNLRRLELSGNQLSPKGSSLLAWPHMTRLQYLDIRHCEVADEDLELLRASLPSDAQVESRTTLLWAAEIATTGGQRVVFESSDEE